MKTVTSMQNTQVKLAASLHLKKYRDEEKLFLVEGREMIGMALQKEWRLHSLFISDAAPDLQVLFLGYKEQALLVPQDILGKIAKKDNPQPVIAVFHQRVETQLPAVFDRGILPALEEIRDPGNLGTIMRTCHALGVEHLALIGQCCDPFAPETIRASMGSFAAVTVTVVSADDMAAWHTTHPAISMIATDVKDAADYRRIDYAASVLLMGNEQKGLSPRLKALCDRHVKIPMPGGAESLNVAMATTILLYEAMRPSL